MALDIGSLFSTALSIGSALGSSSGGGGSAGGGIGGLASGIGGLMGKGGGGMSTPSTGSMVGAAADALCSFLPEKTEYSGDKGNVTKTLDGAYDTISDIAGYCGPVGTAVSGIMKAGKFVGGVANSLGGGTDGMTTTDAVLGSSFFNLTPAGLINGFGGKRADTIKKDNEAFAMTGNSYSGSEAGVETALHYSGKKYGLFSGGARRKANKLINEMGRQLAVIRDIGEANKLNTEMLANQSSLATEGSAFEQAGGYDATATRAAKYGMKFSVFGLNNFLKVNLPKNVSHAIKVAKMGAQINYLKPVQMNYNFEESELTDEMISSLLGTPIFKDGGNIEVSNLPNLIPEGALHKNKHNMENAKDITKKGIPVVVEGKDGRLNQLAEIEREEVIINKELTDKIESYLKQYNETDSKSEKDKIAKEAGELLAVELMTNTNDRTGLMDTIK